MNTEQTTKNSLTEIKPVSAEGACCHCEGTGIEENEYYDEDDNMKIVVVKEKCCVCNGSGVDAW